ncbi:MAG: bifunctional phosphopantothenoylcysteine decarboxylase/phosphopantothenate--cysteine ligase CoaBC [Candidatus Eisenbacteria bacterium]|uniref:Coenzyme A biosynthesis bifunctional protein CoaBC n=1 Tax=Eiseniibacteriota bacterium TaxID=2212470 RepID=A0A538S8W8_UNCEI|nr:MAG: bifunctional phosphopantothenoylcysteine decarboxylase/phosphopantothenate--cysteine ligase CoaBC [Candidatus Eisenbacteria bacterium]
MLSGRTVAVGVSGGIAAYKACELVRWLKARGSAVIVVMTRGAAEFVTPLTFQTLSGNPVVHDLWGDQSPGFDLPQGAARKVGGKVGHVDVAEAADVLVIAPATANLIARLVHGEAPDALTSVALASRSPLIVCPAMDVEMWRNPVTQANVRTLRARGAIVVGPESGPLASGLEGPGRLADIETIGQAVEEALVRRASLEGVRVLVGAGRTEEPIDPVRVLTNRSSGKMGFALAEGARDRGAEVTLVAGPASIDPPERVKRVGVATAAEMEKAMVEASRSAEVVLMAAAVADFRPRRVSTRKVKRDGSLELELEPNPDILARLASMRRKGQVLIGFALETEQGLRRARAKLQEKGVDLIVLNAPGEAIGSDTNRVTLVEARTARRLPVLSKREVAEEILDRALELRAARGGAGRAGRARQVAARTVPTPRARPAAPRRVAARREAR